MLSASLDAVGLNRAVLGLGDADLYRQLLTELGVAGRAPRPDPRPARGAQPRRPGDGRGRGRGPGRARRARRCCACPACGAGRRSSIRPRELGGAAVERAAQRLQQTYDPLVERGVAGPGAARPRPAPRPRLLHGRDRRGLRPGARPHPRRRRPLRRPRRPLRDPMPAAGFGLYLERVHVAQMEEERVVREASVTPPTVESPIRARLGGPAEARDPARRALGGDARRARSDRAGDGRDARRLALPRLRRRTASPW